VTELDALQTSGQIYVVDLIFVTKAADGAVTLREMSEMIDEAPGKYASLAGNLMGLFTQQDIDQLTAPIPADTCAFVILFEHAWVTRFTEAVRQAGGVVFSGGMVPHEIVVQVSAELTAPGKEGKNA